MSEGGGQQGPSMDEILASIRKIISEDDDGGKSDMKGIPPDTTNGDDPDTSHGDDNELVLKEEVPDKDDDEEEIELVDEIKEDDPGQDKRLESQPDKSDIATEIEAAPPPPPPPPPPQPPKPPEKKADPLVGDPQRAKMASSLTSLSAAIREHRPGATVEQLAEDLLRPMLREWLDANLPDMVERLVQKEIQRMADQAEQK